MVLRSSAGTARDDGGPGPVAKRTAHRALDAGGVALLVATIAWVLVAAEGRPASRPWPVVALLGAVGGVTLLARLLSRAWARVAPGAVAMVASALVIEGALARTMDERVIPYDNARAAVGGLGVVAAAWMAGTTTRPVWRWSWLAGGVGLVLLTASIGSTAASLCLVFAVALVGLGRLAGRADPVLALSAGAVVLTLVVTIAIAAGADPVRLGERAGVRQELWAAAADLAREAPLRGVGPGDFAGRHPVSTDSDLRWAHHGPLQMAAETGVVGLVLLLGLSGWALVELRHASVRGGADVAAGVPVAAGAAGWALVSLHACVDYVLHEPAVPLLLAGLLGAATSGRPARLARGGRAVVGLR